MAAAVKIGNDLYETLDPEFQKVINSQPVFLSPSSAPIIAPIPGISPGSPCQVSISAGYIDLINYIAHAKAIDRIQPGFFWQYVFTQSKEKAEASSLMLNNPRYWTDAVMKDQVSFFNEMIGMTLAINFSHHYLGYYDKYAAQMADGKREAINNLVTPAEWEAGVKHAALNSLDCAISTEGAKALFEFISQMPQRPAWTGYIMPRSADIKRLGADLSLYERDYFHGRLKMDKPPLVLSVAAVPNGGIHRIGN